MMRPELLTPAGPVAAGRLVDVLALAGLAVPLERAEAWTVNERAVAYDWAVREHLAASDHQVRRRDKPTFVSLAVGSEHDGLVAALRGLHAEYRVYGSCAHPEHDEADLTVELEDGGWTCQASFQYVACAHCCTGTGGQSERCASSHDHGPGKPICPTRAVVDGQPQPALEASGA